MHSFVSARHVFRRGDPKWETYAAWIGLPHLTEVRTIDASLNGHVRESGSVYCSLSELESAISSLPVPETPHEYLMLAVPLVSNTLPTSLTDWLFLGCDLADETMTSSVLNCGPWTGMLAQFTERLTPFGLLALKDAHEAQRVLLDEWGPDEPHASTTAWALFTRS
jgi:hypothetical protein